jgi:hypothetical protein
MTRPRRRFLDTADVVFAGTILFDLILYEPLDRFVEDEPWLERFGLAGTTGTSLNAPCFTTTYERSSTRTN